MPLSPAQLRECVTCPKEIVAGLDQYIIGQEQAKKNLALFMFNRSLIKLSLEGAVQLDTPLKKINVLLIGHTGTGKTALVRALSKVCDVPIYIHDVTSITSSGYVGGSVDDIIINYIQTYENILFSEAVRELPYVRINDAGEVVFSKEHTISFQLETGIIYLDEIDKIRAGKEAGVDVTGLRVQQELLKLLEGQIIDLSGGSRNRPPVFKSNIRHLSTEHLFFICGGAFSGIEDFVKMRMNKNTGIGFNIDVPINNLDDSKNLLAQVNSEDLMNYGFKPEFLGRLPIRAILEPMTKDLLVRIITEPKESLFSQYKAIFKVFGTDLLISDQATAQLAEYALDLKVGARGLQAVISQLLSDELYNIYSSIKDEIIIDKEMVITRLGNMSHD